MIFTKSDLVTEAGLETTLTEAFNAIQSFGSLCYPFIHAISSLKGTGIDTLKLSIGEIFSFNMNSSTEEEEVNEPKQ